MNDPTLGEPTQQELAEFADWCWQQQREEYEMWLDAYEARNGKPAEI